MGGNETAPSRIANQLGGKGRNTAACPPPPRCARCASGMRAAGELRGVLSSAYARRTTQCVIQATVMQCAVMQCAVMQCAVMHGGSCAPAAPCYCMGTLRLASTTLHDVDAQPYDHVHV
eukprot:gene9571-biopygen12236